MAKKRAAKKKATKKKATKKKAIKPVTITFKCSGGCTAKENPAHADPGALVSLEAKGTDAYLWFVDKSPFASGHKQIVVQDGEPVQEVVADDARGEYDYLLDCKNPGCRSPVNNPKMIVP